MPRSDPDLTNNTPKSPPESLAEPIEATPVSPNAMSAPLGVLAVGPTPSRPPNWDSWNGPR